MKSILILIDSVVTIYIWILIINALLSWLITFNVLNTSNRLVYSILDISYKMTAVSYTHLTLPTTPYV